MRTRYEAYNEPLNKVRSTSTKVLFSVRIPGRNPVIQKVRHYHSGTDHRCELPGKGVRLLALLDRAHNLFHRIIEFQQKWHRSFPTGGEWRLDEARVNDRK